MSHVVIPPKVRHSFDIGDEVGRRATGETAD